MIMDKLGKSLEQLFNYCNRHFSISTVCMIAIQILIRIEELHSKNYLHRDIKPDNFLIGNDKLTSAEAGKIFMIDLGLGKLWRENNGRHIPPKTGKRLIGTPRYASINTHYGYEQSRRDDLESLGYMLMYFVRGRLPWQGLNGPTKEEKYQQIGHKKKTTDLNVLCQGYPPQFKFYLESTQKLSFKQEPPYQSYKDMFLSVLESENNLHNGGKSPLFDWQIQALKSQKKPMICQQQQQQQQRVHHTLPIISNININHVIDNRVHNYRMPTQYQQRPYGNIKAVSHHQYQALLMQYKKSIKIDQRVRSMNERLKQQLLDEQKQKLIEQKQYRAQIQSLHVQINCKDRMLIKLRDRIASYEKIGVGLLPVQQQMRMRKRNVFGNMFDCQQQQTQALKRRKLNRNGYSANGVQPIFEDWCTIDN